MWRSSKQLQSCEKQVAEFGITCHRSMWIGASIYIYKRSSPQGTIHVSNVETTLAKYSGLLVSDLKWKDKTVTIEYQ